MTIKQHIISWLAQFVVPCQVMTHRLSGELENPPSIRERVSSRMHLAICVWCRRYRDQIAVVRDAAQQAASISESAESPMHQLPQESRDRIGRALRDPDK